MSVLTGSIRVRKLEEYVSIRLVRTVVDVNVVTLAMERHAQVMWFFYLCRCVYKYPVS
jgi:hypothetical protein